MRTVKSIDALNIPADYQAYISKYIQNISSIPFISRVMLFGSCARESVRKYSDIDIFITTSREISDDEEMLVAFLCLPEYSIDTIPIDIIVQPESDFTDHIDRVGMVQQQVNKYGVDLSGLLR